MFRSFFRYTKRKACLLAMTSAVIAALVGWKEAQAQFKLPKIPNIPNIPNIGGGGGSRQGSPQDAKNLLELGKKGLEYLEVDNPQRQKELGQSAALGISNRYPVSKNRPLNEYVNLVGFTVASVCPKPELNYAFGVLETNEVGAYSTPGGYIFITRGALNLIQDESELAGILAHEIAHVVLNHGIDAVRNAKLKQVSDVAMKQYGSQRLGAFAQYADEATDFALVKGYSQGQETAADSKAIEYLILAGYDPRGFVRVLDRLQKQAGGQMNPKDIRKQLFSTHPGTAQRIGNTTRQIASYKSIGGATLKQRYDANVKPVSQK